MIIRKNRNGGEDASKRLSHPLLKPFSWISVPQLYSGANVLDYQRNWEGRLLLIVFRAKAKLRCAWGGDMFAVQPLVPGFGYPE